MSNSSKHLRGETNEMEVDVHGHTVVEQGDFVVIMKADSMFVSTREAETTADWYGYPVSSLAGDTPYYFDANFAGIAMLGSIEGTTEKIPVATTGVFRYPVKTQTGVTVGQLACVATSAAKTFYDQQVIGKKTSELTDEYYNIVGTIVKSEAGASDIDFKLISRMSGTSYAYIQTGD